MAPAGEHVDIVSGLGMAMLDDPFADMEQQFDEDDSWSEEETGSQGPDLEECAQRARLAAGLAAARQLVASSQKDAVAPRDEEEEAMLRSL